MTRGLIWRVIIDVLGSMSEGRVAVVVLSAVFVGCCGCYFQLVFHFSKKKKKAVILLTNVLKTMEFSMEF